METSNENSIEAYLRSDFTALLQTLGPHEKNVFPLAEWPTILLFRYTKAHRHYHTTSHIYSMLSCLSRYQNLVKDEMAVKLAIYFHDWVYDPKRNDNEAQSIDSFRGFCDERGLGFDGEMAGKVGGWIESSMDHRLPEREKEDDGDLKLFLDFDLEVLSRGREEYAVYAEQIRKEYGFYSEADYCAGRMKVLKGFLGRERLYFSDVFFEECEGRARVNLEWEIGELEKRLGAVSKGS